MTSNEPQSDILIQRVGFEAMPAIASMNRLLFDEERIINRFDRPDLIMLLAMEGSRPAGFKIGYGLDRGVYYSAKGGILPPFRRRGIASALLDRLMQDAAQRGYTRFTFDTFPNLHTGMTALAVNRGFVVTDVRYSEVYDDIRVRFAAPIPQGTEMDRPEPI